MAAGLILPVIVCLIYNLFDDVDTWMQVMTKRDNIQLFMHTAMLFYLVASLLIIRYIIHKAPSSRLYFYQRDGQRHTVISAVLFTACLVILLFTLLGFLQMFEQNNSITNREILYFTGLIEISLTCLAAVGMIVICVNLIGAISWSIIKFIVRMLLSVSVIWAFASCMGIVNIINDILTDSYSSLFASYYDLFIKIGSSSESKISLVISPSTE